MTRRLIIVCCVLLASTASAQEPILNAPQIAHLQHSVVPLRVPTSRLVNGYRRHHRENCSATVINTHPLTLLSAWHCFDGYDDLSRAAHILVEGNWVDVRLVNSGGSMSADWALVTADAPDIQEPTMLQPLPVLVDHKASDVLVFHVAGYPNTQNERPPSLWVSQRCPSLGRSQQWIGADCSATRGVSGGPALVQHNGTWSVIGVVSAQRSDTMLLVAPLPTMSTLATELVR